MFREQDAALREDENESDNQTTHDGGDGGEAVSTLRDVNSRASGVDSFHNEVPCTNYQSCCCITI